VNESKSTRPFWPLKAKLNNNVLQGFTTHTEVIAQ